MPRNFLVTLLPTLLSVYACALNIPQIQRPESLGSITDVKRDLTLSTSNSTTNLTAPSSPLHCSTSGYRTSTPNPLIEDCAAVIRQLPFHSVYWPNSGNFHYGGFDDGFQLSREETVGTCTLSIDLEDPDARERGSWLDIRKQATELRLGCQVASLGITGGWTNTGQNNGIRISLLEGDPQPFPPPYPPGPDPEPYPDPGGNRTFGHTESNLTNVDNSPNLLNITTNTTIEDLTARLKPKLRCKGAPIFSPDDHRPRFSDCVFAIGILPATYTTGTFHTGAPKNDFELPLRRIVGTCVVSVEMRKGAEVQTGRWVEVQAVASHLNVECRAKEGFTGGSATAGEGAGVKVRLEWSRVPPGGLVGMGRLNETVLQLGNETEAEERNAVQARDMTRSSGLD